MKRSIGERVFGVFNHLFMICLGMVTLYPILNVLAVSFSDNSSVMRGMVSVYPIGFNFSAYSYLLRFGTIATGYRNTLFVLVMGTTINVLLTSMTAYGLSKQNLPGGRFIMVFITFTMLFNGGLIPHFLLVKSLDLINSLWALILPGSISVFNLIVLKSFFQKVPHELIEAASVDGLSELGILFRIVIPLSTAAMATIGLFYAVGHWNSFFSAVLYLNQKTKWTLQVVLRDILFMMDMSQANMGGEMISTLPIESLKRAAIVVTTFPMLLVYPFIQKYFVKGLTIGSVKG
jgi:ABC-type sugar transport system, permease component